jgi:hypothetical protein
VKSLGRISPEGYSILASKIIRIAIVNGSNLKKKISGIVIKDEHPYITGRRTRLSSIHSAAGTN